MKQWIPILLRKGCCPLFYSFIIQGYKDAYYQEILGVPKGINNHQYIDGWVVIEGTESGESGAVFTEYLKRGDYVDFFILQCKSVSEELFLLGGKLFAKDFGSATNGQLMATFMEFSSKTLKTVPFLTTLAILQGDVEKQLSEVLAESLNLPVSSDELKAIMQDIMIKSDKIPLVTQSIRDLNDIIDFIQQNHSQLFNELKDNPDKVTKDLLNCVSREVMADVQKYLDNYDFLATDYYVGIPTTFEQLIKQISIFIRQRSNTQQNTQIHVPKYDATKFCEATKSLITKTQEMHFIRQYRIEAMFKSGRQARNLLAEIGQRIGLSYHEIIHLTYEEIFDSLSQGKLTTEYQIISERIKGYGIVMIDRKVEYLTGAKLEEAKKAMQGEYTSSKKLTGDTAYPGSYTGRAYVVDDLSIVDGIQQGDILVAPMTSPYHVPAMTIAGAVLTNEGGILSHAAIISRELKIPCIVGVDNATFVIKTGDILRVNAGPSVGTVNIE